METLLGGILAILGGLFVALLNDHRETRRLKLQWEREETNRNKEQQEAQLKQIEAYVHTRVALINSLAQPLVQPQVLIQILLPEIWRMGGASVQARASALLLGDRELAEYIGRLEELFINTWNNYQSDPDTPATDFDSLALQLVAKIVVRIELLRKQIMTSDSIGLLEPPDSTSQ